MADYRPEVIEKHWQEYWKDHETFRVEMDQDKPKYYVLDMFPYPSGSGLHVGHPEGYTATDIVARYKRMRGFNVLHPMGWDAFGLPAERAAVRENEHPARLTERFIDNFKRQIQRLGFSYDWSREINTTDPKYYRWTQWIFKQLHERGLAYQAEVPVNWCPAQGTVLANEEIEDGKYVETGDPVYRRNMRQWQLKIPEYAQRLLDDLEELDWPESVKEMQRYWIGRSEGAELDFALDGFDETLRVYTTRPDTLFGCTYMVLAPEHPLVETITSDDARADVEVYIKEASTKSELERTELEKDKSGVFTGAYAINPANNERIPIYISDYVLITYGTGAIMAVPAHDQRDWDFAQKYDIPIREVVRGGDISEGAWEGDGDLVNSEFLDELSIDEAGTKMTAWLEDHGIGESRVNYRLRDWLFSRQRYWGEPFPVIHTEDGKSRMVADEDLPVTLPWLDEYKPTEDGEPPLARAKEWVQITDPATGKPAFRETNTMPQWAGSCWYYLRFIDPDNDEAFVDPAKEQYWMPVDLYIGGAEHAVLHLLYARFWHKVLYDAGLVSTSEPFQKLFNQGMILAFSYKDERGKYYHPDDIRETEDGHVVDTNNTPVEEQVEKMSKSKLNVANPDEVVDEFGADALRLYEMFMGPLDATKPWQTDGVKGMYRFLSRAHRLFTDDDGQIADLITDSEPDKDLRKLAHETTKSVTEDVESLRMNTAISTLIELLNAMYKADNISRQTAERFTLLLAPFAPHLAEELWQVLGHEETLAYEEWPQWVEEYLVDETVTLAIQVNGKMRGTVDIPADAEEAEALQAAQQVDNVASHIEEKDIIREIYVPGKIINFIVK